jgi:hypothetical protein
VLRKLLVKLERQVDLKAHVLVLPAVPSQPVKVRKRASRRAVQGTFEAGEAETRGQRAAAELMQ